MKRVIVLAALLLAACSSTKDVQILKPEINLLQLNAPVDVGYATGPTQIQFEARIANRSQEPITLKRIEIQSVGSGSYILRKEFFTYNESIAPEHFASVKFWAHGYGFATDRGRTPSSEPPNSTTCCPLNAISRPSLPVAFRPSYTSFHCFAGTATCRSPRRI